MNGIITRRKEFIQKALKTTMLASFKPDNTFQQGVTPDILSDLLGAELELLDEISIVEQLTKAKIDVAKGILQLLETPMEPKDQLDLITEYVTRTIKEQTVVVLDQGLKVIESAKKRRKDIEERFKKNKEGGDSGQTE